ncbi:MAG: ABC transporter permease [Anaerolineaceae bacterium]|nr:ABC transporter permease [Formivibrio sp.]MDR3576424.1 ABC transporter permease [Anaerolineaceae bacterium]
MSQNSSIFGRQLGPVEGIVLTTVGSLVLLVAWQTIVASRIISEQLLPPPQMVLQTAVRLLHVPFAGYTLQEHLAASLKRYLMGFILAAALGIPLGLMMGWSRKWETVVSPFLEAFRFIAPIAWVPFAALWFGTGIGGPILIIFSGAFPPCVINAYSGARLIPPPLIEAAQTLGISTPRMLFDVLLPGALPSIVAGLRIASGIGWQSLIGAELIVVSSGIGYLMVQGQSNMDTPIVMVGMLAIGITGFIIDFFLRFVESRVRSKWAQ